MKPKLSQQDLENALHAVDRLISVQGEVATKTQELRTAIKARVGEIQNPNCDGAHCRFSKGDVRVLPTGGDSNIILCRGCYEHEIRWRKERNQKLSRYDRFLLPTWQSLRVYEAS